MALNCHLSAPCRTRSAIIVPMHGALDGGYDYHLPMCVNSNIIDHPYYASSCFTNMTIQDSCMGGLNILVVLSHSNILHNM